MSESWKVIKNTEGIYEVSNLGQVRRVKHVKHAKLPGLLKASKSNTGYLVVGLGRKRSAQIHVLVAEAFLGERPIGFYVDHLDGNKLNPKLTNLEYVSPGENIRRAYAKGQRSRRGKTGSLNPAAKLSEADVIAIRNLEGSASKALTGRIFNVSPATIRLIQKRLKWQHLEPIEI